MVADVSGFYPRISYPTQSNPLVVTGESYTFLFGPQVSLALQRFTPFAHFLSGVAHVTPQSSGATALNVFKSNNAFSFAAGGVVDCSLTRRIAIRGQADLLYVDFTPIGGGDPGVNYVKNRSVARVSTAVVFRF